MPLRPPRSTLRRQRMCLARTRLLLLLLSSSWRVHLTRQPSLIQQLTPSLKVCLLRCPPSPSSATRLTAPSRPHPSGMRAARTSLGSGINETRLAALYQTALLASKAGRHADAAALLEEALAQVRRVYGAPSRTVFVARERNLKSTAVIAADGSEQQQVQQQQAPPAATPALSRAQSSTSTGALASTHMVTVRDVDSVQVLQGNPVELLIMARLFRAHVYGLIVVAVPPLWVCCSHTHTLSSCDVFASTVNAATALQPWRCCSAGH